MKRRIMCTYYVAEQAESGEMRILEQFEACDDSAANAYAEEKYAGFDWYVLDKAKNNINAW